MAPNPKDGDDHENVFINPIIEKHEHSNQIVFAINRRGHSDFINFGLHGLLESKIEYVHWAKKFG